LFPKNLLRLDKSVGLESVAKNMSGKIRGLAKGKNILNLGNGYSLHSRRVVNHRKASLYSLTFS